MKSWFNRRFSSDKEALRTICLFSICTGGAGAVLVGVVALAG